MTQRQNLTRLPNIAVGEDLRTAAARAIAEAQYANKKLGDAQKGTDLAAFFTAAATLATSATDTTAPTVSSIVGVAAGGVTTVTVTFNEALDDGLPQKVESWTIMQGATQRKVSKVWVVGSTAKLYIEATLTTGATLAYAVPMIGGVINLAGIPAAAIAATAITGI